MQFEFIKSFIDQGIVAFQLQHKTNGYIAQYFKNSRHIPHKLEELVSYLAFGGDNDKNVSALKDLLEPLIQKGFHPKKSGRDVFSKWFVEILKENDYLYSLSASASYSPFVQEKLKLMVNHWFQHSKNYLSHQDYQEYIQNLIEKTKECTNPSEPYLLAYVKFLKSEKELISIKTLTDGKEYQAPPKPKNIL